MTNFTSSLQESDICENWVWPSLYLFKIPPYRVKKSQNQPFMVFSGRWTLCTLRKPKSAILNISSSLARFSTHVLPEEQKTQNFGFYRLSSLGFQSILRRSNPIEQLWRNIWFLSVYTLFKLHPTSFTLCTFENLWGVLEIHLGWTPTRKRQECKETKSGSVAQSLTDSQSPCLNTARQSKMVVSFSFWKLYVRLKPAL